MAKEAMKRVVPEGITGRVAPSSGSPMPFKARAWTACPSQAEKPQQQGSSPCRPTKFSQGVRREATGYELVTRFNRSNPPAGIRR